MRISLKKSGMLKLGLSLVAMTVAASVQAKTLVYCSEGSPEGFNPQLFTSGTTYDASSVPLYNRLVELKSAPLKSSRASLKSGKSVKTVKPIPSICVKV